jgi:hypothetical protein
MIRARSILPLAVVFASACLAASDTPIDRESLRDLDSVRVAVEDLPANASANGLSQGKLREAIEGKLRMAGVRVASAAEFPVGDPALHVHLTISQETNGLVAYLVELDFAQIVFLRRNPAVTFNRAQTWAAASQIGLVPPAGLAEGVNRSLSQQVAQFTTAYFSVNPR